MSPIHLSLYLCLIFCFTLLRAGAQTDFEPGKEGLQALCTYILESDYKMRKAMTYNLKPSRKDCEAAFTKEKSALIFRFLKRINSRHIIVLSPDFEYEDRISIWSAQKEDFQDYKGEAPYFPGGYREMAPYLREGITYYRILFAREGHSTGSTFDLFAYVNGHWCLFLSPWLPCMD